VAGPFCTLRGVHGVTHGTVGITLGAITARVLDFDAAESVVLAATMGVGSLIPDADQPHALIWKRTSLERRYLLLNACGRVARMPLLPLRLLPHRGIGSHSPFVLPVLLASVLAWCALQASAVLISVAAAGLAAGCWAHLLEDSCTPSGIPGWPFINRIWLLPKAWRIPVGQTVKDKYGRPVRDRDGRIVRRRWHRREQWFLAVWCISATLAYLITF
jgi:membrane-bound metal-dependent hydrolase YbcI (DUF457 family)